MQEKMVNYLVEIFGEKLLKEPLNDYPVNFKNKHQKFM